MVVTSGYVAGSHMIISGDLSFPANTAIVGNLSARLDGLVGGDVAEGDGVVVVHLRGRSA